jgi:hypothetical protein
MVSGNVAPAILSRAGIASAAVGARTIPAARRALSFIKIELLRMNSTILKLNLS